MRIFFILEHVSGRGSVETVVSTISKFLQQSGHEPFVLLPNPSEFPEWERHLQVHYYDPEPSTSQSPFEWVSKRIIGLSELGARLPRPDVVVGTHVPHTALYSRMAFGHLANVPIVSWLHSVPSVFKDSHFIQYADLHWCISR